MLFNSKIEGWNSVHQTTKLMLREPSMGRSHPGRQPSAKPYRLWAGQRRKSTPEPLKTCFSCAWESEVEKAPNSHSLVRVNTIMSLVVSYVLKPMKTLKNVASSSDQKSKENETQLHKVLDSKWETRQDRHLVTAHRACPAPGERADSANTLSLPRKSGSPGI